MTNRESKLSIAVARALGYELSPDGRNRYDVMDGDRYIGQIGGGSGNPLGDFNPARNTGQAMDAVKRFARKTAWDATVRFEAEKNEWYVCVGWWARGDSLPRAICLAIIEAEKQRAK